MTSENQENVDCSINLEMLTHLKKLRKEMYKNKKLSENSMRLYVQISIWLSNYLPNLSDASLFEIDDLLYANDDLHGESIPGDSLKALGKLLNKCVNIHLHTYLLLFSHNKMPQGRILDKVFLQVIQWISSKKLMIYKFGITSFIRHLLTLRSISRLCLCLKMLKVALGRHKEVLLERMDSGGEDTYYWMMTYLPNIPQGRKPDQMRITSWLTQQLSTINQTFDLKASFKDKTKKYFEIYETHGEQFDFRYANRLRNYVPYHETITCDHLLLFFKSAKNDVEKRQRMKDFLEGGACWSVDHLERIDEGVEAYYEHTTENVSAGWSCFLSMFHDNYESLLNGRFYSDDILRKMEERFGCIVNPYMGGDADKVDEDLKGHLDYETINDSMNYQDENKDEYDFLMEKYLFFNGFVKILNLLNIIHTACSMCQELLQTSGDFIWYDGSIFRGPTNPINKFLRDAILKPSKRGYLPWLIEIMIKKCPFMILPKRYDYLMGDLTKLLKGEDVDELVEEKVFLALNAKCTWFDRLR